MMTIPATIISTAIGAINGYILSKWRFRGSEILFACMLLGVFMPGQIALMPWAFILGKLGLTNTTAGLVLVHTVQGLSFTTLFCRNYYLNIPDDLIKAARIDGAGFWRIFRKIILPLSPPILIVTVIWQFTGIWNEFLYAVVFSSGRQQPITAALIALSDQRHDRAQLRRDERRRADRRAAAAPHLLLRRPLFHPRPDAGRDQVGSPWRRSRVRNRQQELRRRRGAEGHRPRGRGRRVRRAGRPVGLRQVHAARHDRRARDRHLRRDLDRRARRQQRRAEGPRHRDGVPVLRALPDDDGAPEHHLRHGEPRRAEGASRTRRSSASAALLHIEHAAAPQARPALRRPAAARRHGPGAGARSGALPLRRAALQPRRQAPRRDAHRDQEALPARSARPPSTSRTTRSRR